MQIETIKLSKAKMNEAVQRYLAWMNINVEVTAISTDGYPVRGWEVSIKAERQEEPKIKTLQEGEVF